MKCLAQSQGNKVRVNAVLPGLLLTEWVSPYLRRQSPGKELILVQGQRFPPEKLQGYKNKAVLNKVVCSHVVPPCSISY